MSVGGHGELLSRRSSQDGQASRSPSCLPRPRCCLSFGFGVRERPADAGRHTAPRSRSTMLSPAARHFKKDCARACGCSRSARTRCRSTPWLNSNSRCGKLDPSRGIAVDSLVAGPRSKACRTAACRRFAPNRPPAIPAVRCTRKSTATPHVDRRSETGLVAHRAWMHVIARCYIHACMISAQEMCESAKDLTWTPGLQDTRNRSIWRLVRNWIRNGVV